MLACQYPGLCHLTLTESCTGDAKCVLARQTDDPGGAAGKQLKAITLTQEHKAILALEKARIERAGGHVSSNGRLAGAALCCCCCKTWQGTDVSHDLHCPTRH